MQEKEEKKKVTILSRKDLDISYFVGPGDGGQKKQKTSSGVLIIHRETGAMGRCCDSRSQEQNKRKAFLRLIDSPKMKHWISGKIYEMRMGESMEEKVNREVEKMMTLENLIIETYIPKK